MARLVFSGPYNTSPRWMGDYGERDSLIAGGAQLNPSRFTELKGLRQIASGILLGRRTGAYYFEPADNTLKTDLNTYTTVICPIGATTINVKTTSGYRDGDIITIGVTDYTIASGGVDDLNKRLKLTTALSAIVAINTVVKLKTAVDFDEFYLLASDVNDANQCQDCELYRHQSLVYLNYLPGYPFTATASIQAKIKQLYECMMGS